MLQVPLKTSARQADISNEITAKRMGWKLGSQPYYKIMHVVSLNTRMIGTLAPRYRSWLQTSAPRKRYPGQHATPRSKANSAAGRPGVSFSRLPASVSLFTLTRRAARKPAPARCHGNPLSKNRMPHRTGGSGRVGQRMGKRKL